MDKNYIVVPKQDYDKLNIGDYIKYKGKDGELRKGGKIKNTLEKDNRKYYLIKGSTGNFVLYFDTIDILWKQITYETRLLIESNKNMQNQLNKIIKFLKKKYSNEF